MKVADEPSSECFELTVSEPPSWTQNGKCPNLQTDIVTNFNSRVTDLCAVAAPYSSCRTPEYEETDLHGRS